MNRRNFFKSAIGLICGIVGIKTLPDERKRKWFFLKLKDDYKDIEGAEEWLRECEDTLQDVVNSTIDYYDENNIAYVIEWNYKEDKPLCVWKLNEQIRS